MTNNQFLQVFITDISQLLTDDKFYSEAMELVPEQRRQKVSRYRFRKDQSLSLGAGLLLRYACRELGHPGLDRTICCTPSGKPFFPEHPELSFSLSHSGLFSACAVSLCPVGCDVEQRKEADLALVERFFHPEEKQFFRNGLQLPAIESPEREKKSGEQLFCALWTLKESFLKCTGDGLSRPLNSFAVTLTEQKKPDGWNIAALTAPAEEAPLYSLCQRTYGDYSFALCTQSSVMPETEQKNIELESLLN